MPQMRKLNVKNVINVKNDIYDCKINNKRKQCNKIHYLTKYIATQRSNFAYTK